MANKKSPKWHGYLLTCLLGIALMVILYIVFEPLAKRTRSASGESTDTGTGQLLADAVYTSMPQTAKDEETPRLPSAFLGVEIISVDAVIAEQLGIHDGHGVLVNSVVADSPADQAGLQRGDVIAALNSQATRDVDTFRSIMATLGPGDAVRITYVRDGKKARVYVQLAESPAISGTAQEAGAANAGWGISMSPISPALRESVGIPDDIGGVVILSVVPGSAADRAGLAPGNVIVGIDQTPISDMEDLFSTLASDGDATALLDVYAPSGMRYVPMDSSSLGAPGLPDQAPATLGARIFSMFTGGAPFSSDEDDDDDEGPKGGKFAQEDLQLAADVTGFARPSTVPGDANAGGTSTGDTGFSRPSTVPGQTNTGGPVSAPNDIVLFIGLLLLAILYLAYREYHRPPEVTRQR